MQPNRISQTPALTPLSLAHLCAKYLRTQFQIKLNARSFSNPATPLAQPIMLPVGLASELDIIAATLVEAFLNRQLIKWDITRYADKLPKKPLNPGTKVSNEKEASLKKRYPPLDGVTASSPCIIVDMQGIILAWYLPRILNDSRRDAMLAAREKLRPLLESSKSGRSWRNDQKIFCSGEGLQGNINLSSAWFQQGHDETVQEYPQASANFRSPAASDWLDSIAESNAILSAILAVIHPNLYDAGWQTIKRLKDIPMAGPQNVLNRWASVFTGVAVISNRVTPPHRDANSRFNWYDILATLGNYRNCNLELPGLGMSLEYGPGTVVGLSGKVLQHAVHSFEGDRVCYAYFMRDNVHEWANVPASDWMNTRYYE